MLIASIVLVGLSLLLQRNPQGAILPDEQPNET